MAAYPSCVTRAQLYINACVPSLMVTVVLYYMVKHTRSWSIQGHPERVAKVNKLWKSQFSKKISFLNCSWKKSSDKLLPHFIQISQKCFEASLKGCASNVDWVKIRLQEPKKPELAGASGPSMHPESPYFGWEPIFHPNYGQIPCWPKIWSFGGWKTSFGCFEALFELPEPASVGRHNLWGKPQNISERSGWSGGVICRYFSSKNSWEN